MPPLGTPAPGVTTRKQLEADTLNAQCKACHNLIDPYGDAFEGLDAIGRARDMDNGAPVDTSATLPTGEHLVGARQVSSFLAMRPAASSCMATQWLMFALCRDLTTADQASQQLVSDEFDASGQRLRDLITFVLTSPAFLAP